MKISLFGMMVAGLVWVSPLGAQEAPPPPTQAPLIPSVQAPPTQAPPASQPAPAAQPLFAAPQGPNAGLDPSSIFSILPTFDPGSEMVTWNGNSWNVLNNRLFEARFEKYLNSPEVPMEEDRAYQAVLDQIESLLAPGRATSATVDQAFAMLPQASDFTMDASLADSVATAVYNVWLARREDQRITQAITALDKERRRHEWNLQVAGGRTDLEKSQAANQPSGQAQQRRSSSNNGSEEGGNQETVDTTMTTVPGVDAYTASNEMARRMPAVVRIAEVNAALVKARAKQELPLLEARVQFQSLMVHLFLQRRFQHVVIASYFYKNLFGGGDEKIALKGEAERLFSGSTGLPPTVSILESLANEMIRDAKEGVQSFEFLAEQGELASASKRLSEAFLIGEQLAPLRTLPREKKRTVLDFMRKSNQLVSAISVKDYTLAEKVLNEMEAMASDFDGSKPRAAVETARTVATMHLAKAKNAAVSGDNKTLEEQLMAATEIWPRNPALQEVASLIFRQGDVQQRALVDLDQLLSQKNFRQIFDDRSRYIAAVALFPERQEALNLALEKVQKADTVIVQAREIAKRGACGTTCKSCLSPTMVRT